MRRPSVHVREQHMHLLYDGTWQGIRFREFTGLLNTTENRTRCQKLAKLMTLEMGLGTFDYLRHFPEGSQKHKFMGRPDTKTTFRWFADTVWLPHMQTKVRESTVKDYTDIPNVSVYPSLGEIHLKDLRPEHCDRFINDLKKYRWHRTLPIGAQEIEGRPLGPRRQNIILLRVRQVLDLAFERGYMDKNPHTWITLQEEELPEIDPFCVEERKVFLEALPDRRWRNYFIVAFDTGMRPSEQLGLEWPHIDFKRKRILVRQGMVRGSLTLLKTKKSRRDVDMLPTVEAAFHEQPRDSKYVFSNVVGGPLDLTNIRNRIWYPTLKRAGLWPEDPGQQPRDLYQTRHTFASIMLYVGEDPAWIARMMGHTTTRMLYERYGKFIRNRARQDGSAYLEALKIGGR
jgi:integrase